MSKIIDSFLFFQELDLLEIRLEYLDEYVDEFVILEACQTFTGKKKLFVFEENRDRFSRYLHKIKYFKVEDFHENYESIRMFLKNSRSNSHLKVLNILESHTHYSKEHIHWVLDSYHRECLHIALDRYAVDDDIVLLSDLDEIPSIETFSDAQKERELKKPYVYQQNEFRYFLNYFKDNEWLGTISSKYKNIREYSFNLLRMDSKEMRSIVSSDSVKNGGYHFTSCGGVKMIEEKIKSWGHQEFNNSFVLKNIEKNIQQGKDIFMRDNKTNLRSIFLNDRLYFDESMANIVSKYPKLISNSEIKKVRGGLLSRIWVRMLINIQKVFYKIRLRIK